MLANSPAMSEKATNDPYKFYGTAMTKKMFTKQC